MVQLLDYHVVDVFTSVSYAGNQLAIVHLPTPDTLSQDEKQKVAVEFNYSETIFVSPQEDSSFVVSIFTPQSELPLAGHPIIGCACHLFEKHVKANTSNAMSIKSLAGPIQASYDRTTAVAGAEIPHDFHHHKATIDWSRIRPGLSSQLPSEAPNLLASVVSIVNGMNFVLVDFSSQPELLSTVKVSNTDIGQPSDLDEGWRPTLIGSLFFYVKPDQGDGIIRVRQRMIGIGLEDPATGSASSAVSCFLALQRASSGRKFEFELEQGVEMGRRSIIGVEVELKKDCKEIEKVLLKGQAKHVMKGQIEV